MQIPKSKRFDLNRDTTGVTGKEVLAGIPILGASVVITLIILLLLSSQLAAAEPPATVDLNRATVAQLVELPGIGVTRARDIIQYRLKHAFERPSDILRVRGIGRRTYLKLKPFLRVGPARAPGS